jgi:excisionase family DNA binding protein
MADDEILTVAQVATQFHVTPQTVRSWIDSGKLKAGRVGKAYVILRGDVFAMVEQAASERQHSERSSWADERESELSPAGGRPPRALWDGTGGGVLVSPRSR